jgi:HlyD family secretion protein
MADLSTVRIRAFFNESDIGNVHPGEQTNVTVDAYQDRRFRGVVDQIEPEAVIQQNVTMFPVLVNLVNQEGLLMPGMNGEVSVLIDERDGVLAVPNDAIKSPREAVATGAMLGLTADSVNAELKAQGYSPTPRGGFGGGRRGGGRGRGGDATGGAQAPASGAPGGAPGTAGGDVALVQQGQGGGAQGGQGGGFQQASDADCTTINATLKAHPAEKKQLDDLRAKLTAMRPAGAGGNRRGGNGGGNGAGANASGGGQSGGSGGGARRSNGGNGANGGGDAASGGQGRRGNPQMQAINEQMRAIYTKLNIDPRTAGSCARRQSGTTQLAAGGQSGQSGQGGQLTPQSELGRGAQRTRPGLVFVADSGNTRFHPRIVQIGEANLDYTEIVSGLKEGEHVVMLSALALQAARQAQLDRVRGAASPLGGGPGGGRGRG